VVVEVAGSTVIIVGLPEDEVAQVLDGITPSEPSWTDRTRELVESIVVQLGYPRLS